MTKQTKISAKFCFLPFMRLRNKIIYTGKWFQNVLVTEEREVEHIREQGYCTNKLGGPDASWSQDYYVNHSWKIISIK